MRITRRFPSLFELTIALYSWQALLLYLYNDHLEFTNLRSEGRAPSAAAVGIASPQCSPKSMYRVAEKVVVCSSRYIFLVSALYLSVRRRTAQERSTSQYQVQSITAQHLRGALLNLYIHVRSC